MIKKRKYCQFRSKLIVNFQNLSVYEDQIKFFHINICHLQYIYINIGLSAASSNTFICLTICKPLTFSVFSNHLINNKQILNSFNKKPFTYVYY